jgi:hypothetical protein
MTAWPINLDELGVVVVASRLVLVSLVLPDRLVIFEIHVERVVRFDRHVVQRELERLDHEYRRTRSTRVGSARSTSYFVPLGFAC